MKKTILFLALASSILLSWCSMDFWNKNIKSDSIAYKESNFDKYERCKSVPLSPWSLSGSSWIYYSPKIDYCVERTFDYIPTSNNTIITLIDLRNDLTIAFSSCYTDYSYPYIDNTNCDQTGYDQKIEEYIWDPSIDYREYRKKQEVQEPIKPWKWRLWPK